MRWHLRHTLPWEEPLDFAARVRQQPMCLFYSSRSERWSGQQSFLLLEPQETVEATTWHDLPVLPKHADGLPYWAGYLGYGLRGAAEPALNRGVPGPVPMPESLLIRYGSLYRFNHASRTLEHFTQAADYPIRPLPPKIVARPLPAVVQLCSNFSRDSYMQSVRATLEQIAAGNFYQANITRKFYGAFADAPDTLALFANLCTASPAAYSCYLKQGELAVLSSSPESFLEIAADSTITTRPIKGSAARLTDDVADIAMQQQLANSAKNHAENLMITDLMRHDLGQISQPGSVRVAEQSALYSYATIHHLVSTITAQKRPDCTAYDVVRACFPPGSMTGAPKFAAMQWCTEQEQLERGVYSGALGWFGGGDTADLSVVIRTLVCVGQQFEFQVGGGIVADSDPTDEWRETLIKARGIGRAIGIAEATLEAL